MALSFPNMFYKNSTQVLEGVEGTKNDLYLMLHCEKGEQLGDPDFGLNLHKAKFKTNTSLAKELVTDSIIEAQNFVGNVLFLREDVQVKRPSPARIEVYINAIFSQVINKRELVVIKDLEVD